MVQPVYEVKQEVVGGFVASARLTTLPTSSLSITTCQREVAQLSQTIMSNHRDVSAQIANLGQTMENQFRELRRSLQNDQADMMNDINDAIKQMELNISSTLSNMLASNIDSQFEALGDRLKSTLVNQLRFGCSRINQAFEMNRPSSGNIVTCHSGLAQVSVVGNRSQIINKRAHPSENVIRSIPAKKPKNKIFRCAWCHESHPEHLCQKYPDWMSRLARAQKQRLCTMCVRHTVTRGCRKSRPICRCRGIHMFALCSHFFPKRTGRESESELGQQQQQYDSDYEQEYESDDRDSDCDSDSGQEYEYLSRPRYEWEVELHQPEFPDRKPRFD